jgi:hypothetical protein
MKQSIFKYFKLLFFLFLIFHLINLIYTGFEFPFDSIADFLKKLFLTLVLSLPKYMILSLMGGVILGVIFKN